MRRCNCWSLRCSRRCSNFILSLTPGFNILYQDNSKARGETFKFWNLVRLILEIWWYLLSLYSCCCWIPNPLKNFKSRVLASYLRMLVGSPIPFILINGKGWAPSSFWYDAKVQTGIISNTDSLDWDTWSMSFDAPNSKSVTLSTPLTMRFP